MPKASCWSWDAFGIPQPTWVGGAVPPCRRHGGRFRVAALAQLREIAAEKEVTLIMQKTHGWIYLWGG